MHTFVFELDMFRVFFNFLSSNKTIESTNSNDVKHICWFNGNCFWNTSWVTI